MPGTERIGDGGGASSVKACWQANMKSLADAAAARTGFGGDGDGRARAGGLEIASGSSSIFAFLEEGDFLGFGERFRLGI